jgi:hypothetical protein
MQLPNSHSFAFSNHQSKPAISASLQHRHQEQRKKIQIFPSSSQACIDSSSALITSPSFPTGLSSSPAARKLSRSAVKQPTVKLSHELPRPAPLLRSCPDLLQSNNPSTPPAGRLETQPQPCSRASFLQPLSLIITTQPPWFFISDLSAIQSLAHAQLTAGKISPGRLDQRPLWSFSRPKIELSSNFAIMNMTINLHLWIQH